MILSYILSYVLSYDVFAIVLPRFCHTFTVKQRCTRLYTQKQNFARTLTELYGLDKGKKKKAVSRSLPPMLHECSVPSAYVVSPPISIVKPFIVLFAIHSLPLRTQKDDRLKTANHLT